MDPILFIQIMLLATTILLVISMVFWKKQIIKNEKQQILINQLKEILERYEKNPIHMKVSGKDVVIGGAFNPNIAKRLNELLSSMYSSNKEL